jgi:hypothetical protein
MRKVAAVPPAVAQRTAINRLMLVTNPQSSRYHDPDAVILYAYMIAEPDGPSFTAWVYPDAEAALDRMREMWGNAAEAWHELPDQIPGCQDDWIAPVRIPRAANGQRLYHQWEQLLDGAWVPIDGPGGGYGLQIEPPPA